MTDDRIFAFTKIVAGLVVPFLVLAFIILYFFPHLSGERFAWAIQPNMTAMFMGAGYIGGAWLFVNTVFGNHWHRVAPGFPPVFTFASSMMLATVLHWQAFDPSHFPFILWLILYLVSPLLILAAWLRNRRANPADPPPGAASVPPIPRWGLALLGLGLLLFAAVGFFAPDLVREIWPWQLSPLTARILSGWFSLLGVGGLVISRDARWSAWKVGLQSIGVWHLLVLLAAAFNPADFNTGLINWYLISVVLVLMSMLALYLFMEIRSADLMKEALDG